MFYKKLSVVVLSLIVSIVPVRGMMHSRLAGQAARKSPLLLKEASVAKQALYNSTVGLNHQAIDRAFKENPHNVGYSLGLFKATPIRLVGKHGVSLHNSALKALGLSSSEGLSEKKIEQAYMRSILSKGKFRQFADDQEIDKDMKLLEGARSFLLKHLKKGPEHNLFNAVQSNNDFKLRLLLKQIGNINLRDSFGRTALMMARSSDIAKLLLEEGLPVNVVDDYGKSALMHAVIANNIEVAQLLIDHGADIDARDVLGRTALIHAVLNGDSEIVKILIDKGADLNAKDISGATALRYAHDEESDDVIKVLLENGASFDAGSRVESSFYSKKVAGTGFVGGGLYGVYNYLTPRNECCPEDESMTAEIDKEDKAN